MKRFLWAAGALLLLLAAATLALPSLVNVEQFRGVIRAELEKSLARPVEFSGMRLRPWPLSIALENVRVAEDAAFATGRPFLQCREIDVHVDLLALLRSSIRIDDFTLDAPALELVRTGERWNYATLGRASGEGPSSPVRLKRLAVRDGSLAISELGRADSRTVYDGLQLTLRDVEPGRPFGLSLASKLGVGFEGQGNPLQGKLTATKASLPLLTRIERLEGTLDGAADITSADTVVSATGRLDLSNARYRGAPVTAPNIHADFRLKQDTASSRTDIEALKLVMAGSALNVTGAWPRVQVKGGGLAFGDLTRTASAFAIPLPTGVTAKGEVAVDLAFDEGAAVQGSIRAVNLELAGSSLKQPVRTPDLTLAITPRRIVSREFTAETAGARLRAQFALEGYNAAAPVIDATLQSDASPLPDLLRLARAYGVGGVDTLGDARGTAALDVRVTGPVRDPARLRFSGKGSLRDALLKAAAVDQATFDFAGDSVRLTAGRVKYEGFVLDNVRTTLKLLGESQFRLDPLVMDLFGGHHDGAVTIDNRGPAPKLQLRSKLERADADQLLSRFTGLQKIVHGAFTANGDLSLTLDDQVARSLTGQLQLKLTDGKLAGVNFLDEVAGLGKFLQWVKKRDQFTSFLEIAGALTLANGVASSEDLRLRLDKATVSSSGTLNLVDQALRMRTVTTLGKALSDEVGGTRVGGFMNTAFSNRAGELVIPALLTGTFAKPKFAPDTEAIARARVQTFEPEKAKQQVEKIFDIFRKKK